MSAVGIIGAGAWGTALANVAAAAGNDVILWARDPDHASALQETRENARNLPGIALDDAISATGDLSLAATRDTILMVVPAQATRGVAQAMEAHVPADADLIACAKGIETATGKLQSEVIAETLPGVRPAVLSGPTFAAEVAHGLPTAVTLATGTPETGDRLTRIIGTPTFRPYASTDLVGAQIGGAVKNVIAIACGIIDGRGLGLNARAALIARAVAEIDRLAVALGGDERTVLGLSGLGDLTLTCTSTQSRNYALGAALGRGEIDAAALRHPDTKPHTVTEGVYSVPGVLARAAEHGLDMPISAAVAAVLHDGADIDATIEALLARPLRREQGGQSNS